MNEGSLPQLLAFFNNIWRMVEIPSEWMEAVAIPIRKQGRNTNAPSSYRPISLKSCHGKIMEIMVLRRLNYHLEAAEALLECFSRFRMRRCTADSIGDLVSLLEDAKAKKHSAALILLHIKQVFDAMPHAPIMGALRRLGDTGRPLRYIQAFLSDRSVAVKVGKSTSSSRYLMRGAPQGTVISPLLFLAGLSTILAATRAGGTA
ncbi:reverse transcriptase, putative [Ixodes scapularis]|uniref:Reverse transcriptase, putative n=1 Tax=Ixodes scapularis TaxID=6945 RepID=B7PK95_IXOSC|nr:reverse transcriptase, putative [Ixodes scapularis]|eukprot:XP_002409770.1 reverse transcriptase, putative [Ixodes scapularis]